ncbi:DUF3540 domain-containing protein [Caldimonas brevitalea]|uniref:DUF3540 domain-containing protein n=1 Tax=Caldimonas brevitalea TaxID=413882 RepID=A0A0G3BHH3_9BURK|nr:DUF3540 domain-containing protein [Caldimonas brevitalea]AKJ28884.1 hypothetical protein AAW51_2193 [Caldimonas brevitalea]
MLMQADDELFVQGVIHEIGEVERTLDATVTVSTPYGLRRARLAASCLVRPGPGDTVLVAGRGDACFVLSVLERHAEGPLELHLDRDTRLDVQGQLSVQTTGATRFGSATEVAIDAPSVELRGDKVALTGAQVSIAAQSLTWMADTLEATARWCRQVADVWSLRARHHQREVEEMELVRVGHLDLQAQQVMNLRARHTVLRSDELTKVDGKQVQVG